MLRKVYSLFCLLTIASCTNIEDASPTNRTSFVRYYGTQLNQTGVMALPDRDGGYIILSTIVKPDLPDILVIKTDDRGNTLWQTVVPNGTANAITVADDGYYITGDKVYFNNRTGIPLSEVINTEAYVFKLDNAGTFTTGNELVLRDTTDADLTDPTIDFKGHASTIENDTLYLLGSYKLPQLSVNQETYEQAIIASFPLNNLGLAAEPAWLQIYNAQQRDFKNTNSLHLISAGAFLWANSFLIEEDGLSNQDANIYVAPKNSPPADKDALSESGRQYSAADLQRGVIGYGLVGTYSQRDGTGSNIYFARYTGGITGSIDEANVRYFDGESLALDAAERDNSSSQDEGRAITGTRDGGFVLACSFTSTLSKGNGGKDLLLIKLDAFGNLQWSELIGGSGDEVPSTIRETSDGSLLICGSIKLNELTSVMLVKTTSQGKLTN